MNNTAFRLLTYAHSLSILRIRHSLSGAHARDKSPLAITDIIERDDIAKSTLTWYNELEKKGDNTSIKVTCLNLPSIARFLSYSQRITLTQCSEGSPAPPLSARG